MNTKHVKPVQQNHSGSFAARGENHGNLAVNPDSIGRGFIWTGNTADPGTLDIINQRVQAIGPLAARFEAHGLRRLRCKERDQNRIPKAAPLYYHYFTDPGTDANLQRWPLNQVVFQMDVLHQLRPDNDVTTAGLFLRYIPEDGRYVLDPAQHSQFFSVMRWQDLESAGLLCDGKGRDPDIVLLAERVSGLVLPLPHDSVVSWLFYSSGSGIDFEVHDGKALMRRMRCYPMYFLPDDDPEGVLDAGLVKQDIEDCISTLESWESGAIDPCTVPEHLIPRTHFEPLKNAACRIQLQKRLRRISGEPNLHLLSGTVRLPAETSESSSAASPNGRGAAR